MAGKLVLGIDPDTTTIGWSVASSLEVMSVGVIRCERGAPMAILRYTTAALEAVLSAHKDIGLFVVEGQQIYPGAKESPNDILTLGQVAGGIFGQLLTVAPGIAGAFPKPFDWKGQVPKPIDQARTFSHYGIEFTKGKDYTYPAGCARIAKVAGASKLNKSDWKHVADAVGLALWGCSMV